MILSNNISKSIILLITNIILFVINELFLQFNIIGRVDATIGRAVAGTTFGEGFVKTNLSADVRCTGSNHRQV